MKTQNTPRCIHVEGLDLAGKTSACRGLVSALGEPWRIRRNSLCLNNPVYELADTLRKRDAAGADTLGLLYVAAVAADIEGYVLPTEDTIQESTILLRSLAYHTVAATPFVVEPLRAMLPKHPRFPSSVVLTANRQIRLDRLATRRSRNPEEVAPEDLLVEQDPDRFFAMERELIKLATRHFGAVVIDTSTLNESKVVAAILATMSRAA